MKSLYSEKVWTYTQAHPEGHVTNESAIRKTDAMSVTSYVDLMKLVAGLQFHNPNYVLLFRGQNKDHRVANTGNSTLRPNIFRRDADVSVKEWNRTELPDRYKKLLRAEKLLVEHWPQTSNEIKRRLVRSAVIKWAILQHYEVCDTPLLDVTQSLRIAASFASLQNPSGKSEEDILEDQTTQESFLYVLAVPNISGAVTSSAFEEIQTLRLASLCPPTAMRPHLQEGFLLGEYPELRTVTEKMNVELHETDFGKRIIAKFAFCPDQFWNENSAFSMIPKKALYPNENDDLFEICTRIRSKLRLDHH